ncbi:MAG: transposase [Candidatus Micrarchaeota archaeon]|nr:transposase [Candidatus Micrarchaeota archaeon]
MKSLYIGPKGQLRMIGTRKPTYGQENWTAYNKAKTQEMLLLLEILADLVSYVPKAPRGFKGKPMRDFGDLIFAGVVKEYMNHSSRRLISDLVLARERGHMGKVPHYNTIIKYMGDSRMTPILLDLIHLSALPLRDHEETFLVDASGISKALYSRWFDVRFKKKLAEEMKAKDWLKIHLICGSSSHIICTVVVTDGKANDSPHLPKLVLEAAKNFRIKEVCADKGYLSRANVDAITSVGAVPFIPLKSNSNLKAKGSSGWKAMCMYAQLKPDEFMKHYHKRSNVETVFSTLKRKFGVRLLFKGEIGMVNEILCRILAYNIAVLVQMYFVINVDRDFRKFAHLFASLHTK